MVGATLDARQEMDIHRAAALMVGRYGGAAAARSARRACVLLSAGYTRAAGIWSHIASITRQLHNETELPVIEEPMSPALRSVQPLRSPYLSGRVRPTQRSSAGRCVAVGRLIPSLSPSVGTP